LNCHLLLDGVLRGCTVVLMYFSILSRWHSQWFFVSRLRHDSHPLSSRVPQDLNGHVGNLLPFLSVEGFLLKAAVTFFSFLLALQECFFSSAFSALSSQLYSRTFSPLHYLVAPVNLLRVFLLPRKESLLITKTLFIFLGSFRVRFPRPPIYRPLIARPIITWSFHSPLSETYGPIFRVFRDPFITGDF